MMKADRAEVAWDAAKKMWRVRIQVGEEVIKRPASGKKLKQETAEEVLRQAAIETARADGYEVDPETVTVSR